MLSVVAATISPLRISALAAVAQCAAIMLAGVLMVAAAAKFRDRIATTNAFRGLRLPFARELATGVPLAEVGIALLLLGAPRLGGSVAALLFVGFSIVLSRAQRFGTVRCGCFGAADSEPVTWVTFVRNALLTATALLVAIVAPSRPGSAGMWVATITGAATFALIGAVLLAVLNMARTIGTVFGQPATNGVSQ